MPEHAQTVGLSYSSINGRIKYLKTFINWCMKDDSGWNVQDKRGLANKKHK